MQLRSLHRGSAILFFGFVSMHIANHLASLHSVALHIAVMNTLRSLYRQPALELLILACVAFQAASGLVLVARGWATRSGFVARLQAVSGTYLAFFLLVHVAAVLYGRIFLQLDTNFYYAAAGLHVHPFEWFFAPYYFLAVLAFFAHTGCALYWRFRGSGPNIGRAVLTSAIVVGFVVSSLITASLAGALEPVDIPSEYRATYELRLIKVLETGSWITSR